MSKLRKQDVSKAAALLEAHESISEALKKIAKPKYAAAVSVISTEDSTSDYVEVGVGRKIAKVALLAMKAKVEKRLRKMKVSIK